MKAAIQWVSDNIAMQNDRKILGINLNWSSYDPDAEPDYKSSTMDVIKDTIGGTADTAGYIAAYPYLLFQKGAIENDPRYLAASGAAILVNSLNAVGWFSTTSFFLSKAAQTSFISGATAITTSQIKGDDPAAAYHVTSALGLVGGSIMGTVGLKEFVTPIINIATDITSRIIRKRKVQAENVIVGTGIASSSAMVKN